MRITDIISNNSTADKPSDLVANYLQWEQTNGVFAQYLLQFDYDSREEIAEAIRTIAYSVVTDRYMSSKRVQEDCPRYRCIYRRFSEICNKLDKFDRYPQALSGELWYGDYARRLLNRNTERMFADRPNADVYANTRSRIQSVYSLTDTDMDKITYFVQQTKAGAMFPPSLRRMLYLYGEKKKTGKTTTATMLICILNGDSDYTHINEYSTILSREMQIKNFAVPKIANCNAALMDECFYSDMGKTYADFKRFLTANNGSARLPYGQEFEWYGQPNYIATSNDPLRRFIKDWNDRRYLSVRFDAQPQQMSFDEIYEMWRVFCVNVPEVNDWYARTREIEQVSFEIGEREERANEFEIELQQQQVISAIQNLQTNDSNRFAACNKITLKFFVDLFAQKIGTTEANRRRDEIEQAVLRVYGQRYSTQTYWLLPDLKKRIYELQYNADDGTALDDEDIKMPF